MFAKLLILAACSVVFFRETVSKVDMCEDWGHHPYGMGMACCQHKTVEVGIGESAHWKECISHPKDEKENYTTSVWKVYACLLEKSLPKGQKTIKLSKFAEIMTAKYPADSKKKIKKGVEDAGKDKANKAKTWLTADVKLSDYKTLDKLRADYFNIEKKACGGGTAIPEGEEKGKPWDSCNFDEEALHRAGDCCGNRSLPFYDHHHGPYDSWKPTTCEKTLKPKFDKLGLKDEDKEDFLEDCKFACYLVEKKQITIDHLVKVKSADTIDTDKFMKDLIPTYVSNTVAKDMKANVKKYFNNTWIMESLIPHTFLGEKASAEDLFGCYAYGDIFFLGSTALHHMCDPEYLDHNVDHTGDAARK